MNTTTSSAKPTSAAIALALAAVLVGGATIVQRSNLFAGQVSAQLADLVVDGVAPNHSSARVYFEPVSGAKDYRVYDVTAPTSVKYAGMAHLSAGPGCPGGSCQSHFVMQSDGVTPAFPYQVASGASGGPQVLNVPATDIEWNSLGDGQAHTLIVEALDQLGPVPQANLYTTTGQSGAPTTPIVSPPSAGAMLGSNKGPTSDGNVSTNGQGPYTNKPQVIARSQPFVVQPSTGYKAVPSRASATQVFYDSFENAEQSSLTQIARSDNTTDSFGNLGQMTFSLNGGTPKEWTIEFRRADNQNSMPFISSDHFMDMLFDGATPGVAGPGHTTYGSMAMTPKQTLDISGGKVAHLTMEVDAHQSLRRWMAFELTPASDPLQGWDPNGFPINNADQGLFLEFRDGGCTLDIFTGRGKADGSPTGTAGGSEHGARLWGQAGSTGGAPIICGWDQTYNPTTLSKNGLGLDDRSRYDFFVSQSHAALFQDGKLIVQSDIPAGSFPWATGGPLKAYYSHYIYHSEQDQADLKTMQIPDGTCYPLNSYWFNDAVRGTSSSNACNAAYPAGYGFPYSDERHWDNMGFEVLLAGEVPANDFAALSSSVQLAQIQPVNGGSAGGGTGGGGTGGSGGGNGPGGGSGSGGGGAAAPTSTPTPGQATAGSAGKKQWVSVTPPGVSLDFNNPPTNFGLNTVATDPTNPGTVYIGSNYQGLFKSTDRGTTWVKINTGPGSDLIDSGRIWTLAVDPFNPNTLYAGSGYGSGGPLKSTDGGVSWTHTLPAGSGVMKQIGTNDIYNVTVDPYTPNHLLVSFHYFWYDNGSSGVLESSDGGASWTIHNPPSGSGWGAGSSVWFLDNSQTWLLGSQSGGLWRTTDGGQNWSQVSNVNIAHGGINSLYRSTASGTLYTAVWNGILRSTDNGRTWQPFTQGLPYAGYETVFGDGVSLYTAPSSPTGGDNGQARVPWFTASEAGGNWAPYNVQQPCLNNICNGPVQMAFDGSDGTVYAVNWNAGAWKLQSGAPPLPVQTPVPTAVPDIPQPPQPDNGSGDSARRGGSASARGGGSRSGGGSASSGGGGGGGGGVAANVIASAPVAAAAPLSQPAVALAPRPAPPPKPVEAAPVEAAKPDLLGASIADTGGALANDVVSVVVPEGVAGAAGANLNILSLDPGSVPPPPASFKSGARAFVVTLVDGASGANLSDFRAPIALDYRLSQAEMSAARGDTSRIKLAQWLNETWVAVPCSSLGTTLSCWAPRLGLFTSMIAAPAPEIQDFALVNGWFFMESNGFDGAGDTGFAVVDDPEASFWTEFTRYGGLETLGYPVTQRFAVDGLPTQVFQRSALQWLPDQGVAVPLDIFDVLSARGSDHWLDAARQIPPAFAFGQGDDDNRTELLEAYPQLAEYYSPDVAALYGLPSAVKQYGSLVSVRLQRGLLQLWTSDVLDAAAGSVVMGNAGDVSKDAGLWPATAIVPTLPPVDSVPVAVAGLE